MTLLVTACSVQTAAAPNAEAIRTLTGGPRSNDSGQVTVSVDWAGISAGPVFDVTMDTHAVDLAPYDLAPLAFLRVDGGDAISALVWNAPRDDNHHREGPLVFPNIRADGQPLVSPSTRSVELRIRDVAGVPVRTFQWE